MYDCVVLGDRGYLSESIQLDLFQTVNIKFEKPKRINQKNYQPEPYIFRKSRKELKHYFLNYVTSSYIRRNFVKTFEGPRTRILAKITALIIVKYINKYIFDKPISNIKK